ncbi:MAG: flagellar basal body P-ring formation protein FlgA [Bacteroidetes bacterium]|jgi:flagella basal body P-ring formation protein FlgA|nr:flagellar basal body P-ring formation protein FlgA [Bacteroidota bacterium]
MARCASIPLLVLLLSALPAAGSPAASVIGTPPPDLSARVEAAAAEALTARFPAMAQRLAVEVTRLHQLPDIPSDRALRVQFSSSTTVPRGRVQATVESRASDAAWAAAGRALLYVAHYDSVMVPTETLRADDALAAGAVAPVWMDVTRFSGTPLRLATYRTLQATGPVYAARHLREGRALRTGDLRPAYTVLRGQAVTMTYHRPLFTLTLRGTAREAGHTGDVIRVYVADTKATYRARITGAAVARWVETL